jgi:hypothetical protein
VKNILVHVATLVCYEVEEMGDEPIEADVLNTLRSHERLDGTVVPLTKRCGVHMLSCLWLLPFLMQSPHLCKSCVTHCCACTT